jgi:hypothetical protein
MDDPESSFDVILTGKSFDNIQLEESTSVRASLIVYLSICI